MKCDKCKDKMVFLSEDEGGMQIRWCSKCGTIATVLIGEDEVEFTSVGNKPSWYNEADNDEDGEANLE